MRLAVPTLALASLAACAACGHSTSTESADPVIPPSSDFTGGSLTVCDGTVTTMADATPPRPGRAQLGADPTPWAVHLGLAGDPTTTMTVSWRTRDDATLATTVELGTGGAMNHTSDGVTFAYNAGTASPVRVHEAHLCGLSPDTVYTYRVGGVDGAGREAWSAPATFHTAPARGSGAPVTIGVLGDTRSTDYTKWGQMLAALQTAEAPDLIVFTGDAVTWGTTQSDWDLWLGQAEPVLRQVPLVYANGNHELDSLHKSSLFALPGDERDYSLDYGAAHITVVDDSAPEAGWVTTQAAPFLDADLAAAPAGAWKLVANHRALYSSAAGHGGAADLVAAWGPILDAHHADLVLNGHDHDYERSKPLKAGAVQASPADGTVYVVAGTAGAPPYPAGKQATTAVSTNAYNMVVLRVRAGTLDFKAVDDAGAVLDRFTLTN